jgi:hypothetical protein
MYNLMLRNTPIFVISFACAFVVGDIQLSQKFRLLEHVWTISIGVPLIYASYSSLFFPSHRPWKDHVVTIMAIFGGTISAGIFEMFYQDIFNSEVGIVILLVCTVFSTVASISYLTGYYLIYFLRNST